MSESAREGKRKRERWREGGKSMGSTIVIRHSRVGKWKHGGQGVGDKHSLIYVPLNFKCCSERPRHTHLAIRQDEQGRMTKGSDFTVDNAVNV